jgi:hypothetical protein
MRIGKFATLSFLVIVCFFIWKAYGYFHPNLPARFAENKSEFIKKEAQLNLLVGLLLTEIHNGKIPVREIKVEGLPLGLKAKMQQLGFRSVEINFDRNECKKHSFIFNVEENWNIEKLGTVQLIFSPCDVETRNEFHSFDGFHIDVFGLGNNWKILSDTDFV